MAYRSSTSFSRAGATGSGAISTTVPSGIAANDICILVFTWDVNDAGFFGTLTITPPTGFTQIIYNSIASPDGQVTQVWWKRCDGTESGSFTVTATTQFNNGDVGTMTLSAVLFSGRDTTNPPVAGTIQADTNGGAGFNTSPVTSTAPAVTALGGDDLLFYQVPDPSPGGIAIAFGSAPSGFTEREVMTNVIPGVGEGWCDTQICTQDNVSAGSTGGVSGTMSFTTGGGNAFSKIAGLVRIPAAAAGAQPSGSSDYYSMRSVAEGMITSANPHLLQYDGFAPFPKTQAQGDAGYFSIEVVPPTKAGRPAFESYPPRGNVPSPTVPYGKTDYFDLRLYLSTLRLTTASQMQHDAYAIRFVQQLAPPGAGGPVWFYDARIQLLARAGKPNIFTFPFDGFQPLGSVATVAQVYGADSYFQSDVYPKLRFRDQHDAYAPRGLVPTAATPQGWTAYFDEDHPPKFKSSLHPVDQDQTPDLPPFVAPSGWTAFFDTEQISRAKVQLFPVDQDNTPDIPPFAATQGWTATFDSKAIKARPVREYEATGITFTTAATVVTGASDYQSFDLFQPFRSARFPYEAAYPAMGLVPTAATPQGWWTPLDVARGKAVPTSLQQFDAYQHFFPPVAVNLGPLGWSMYWDRGRKPVLSERLPFLFEQLYQTPTAATPQGWTHELGRAVVRGFPAKLQQYDALQRLSFVPPFIVPPGDWYDVRIIKPRARDYQVLDRPMFFPPPFPFDWVDARIIRPRAVSYSVIDQQPVVAVPPSAYVLFPELFKRPRPFPYLLWPEQRVAVLNTPAGTGGPTHYFDRRLAVFHRPLVDVLTYDYRGLPFVVVNLIIQKPGPAGLLSGVSLSATKAQDTLAGLKGGTGLQGEVEG